MSLLPLAITIGLCLVFTCLVFFVREQARRSRRAAAGEPQPDELAERLAEAGSRLPAR
jgi:hypothetical protein